MLPYWGDVGLFKKTVESVITQTSNRWHLTVIDDCYPSLEASEWIKTLNHPQITYIRHKSNMGITNNFNFAVERANADFCAIVGCDDKLLPNYVETALQNIGEADFYQPGVDVIDAHDNSYVPTVDKIKRFLQPKRSGVYSGEKLAKSLCLGNWLYFPSIVWKTSTLKKYCFDSAYKIAQDVVLELNIIKDGGTLYFDKTITFQYRRFSESLSSKEKTKGGVRFDEENEVYARFGRLFREMGWKKAAGAAELRIISRIHKFLSQFKFLFAE